MLNVTEGALLIDISMMLDLFQQKINNLSWIACKLAPMYAEIDCLGTDAHKKELLYKQIRNQFLWVFFCTNFQNHRPTC